MRAATSSRVFGAMLLTTSFASAQAQPDETALAEGLFQHGRALMAESRVSEACLKFAESQRLEPKLGTLLNLALCHEREGKTATAWAEFTRAATEARTAGQPEREALALKHMASLERVLPRLSITWNEPAAGQVVLLDGMVLGPGTIGTALPIDPGEHVIETSAPNRHTYSAELRVDPGPGVQSVELPRLEKRRDPPDPVPTAPRAEDVARPMPVKVQTRSRNPSAPSELNSNSITPSGARKKITWITGGVGLTGLVAGSYFGLQAFALKREADKECQGSACSQNGLDLHDQVRGAAAISTVAFAIGAASAGVCLYLILSEDRAASRRGAQVLAVTSW